MSDHISTPIAESRVKKTLLNARVNLIFYFLQLVLSFFSRKIFLDCLGADFIGLTGTLQNLLGFLNLAELGVGAAIGYLLYKPLFDHDEDKITEIISVMGYLYRQIGYIILGCGLLLSCFLPVIFPDRDAHINLGIIYFSYFVFLASSLIGYFINYRQNLLGADQRNYVVTAYFKTAFLAKTVIQIVQLYYIRNLYLWVSIEFLFSILYAIILNWKIHQTYPWLKANIALGKSVFKKYPEVIKKTKQIFAHRIGAFFQYQTMPFLIYSFSSLSMVAYYQNYTIITERVGGFFGNILTGSGASVGNLIAEGNKQKTLAIFEELLSLRFFIGGLICVPTFLLVDSFIAVWLGSHYILPTTTLLFILIPVFIGSTRGTVDDFIFGHGLFWDVWAPLVESVILLTVGIVAGSFWGLNGVLLGPIVSLIIVIGFWKPFFLFHWGFKKNIVFYWMMYMKNALCIAIPAVITYFIMKIFDWNSVSTFFIWFLNATLLFIIYAAISYLAFLLFTNGMKAFNLRLLKICRQILHR